MSDIHVGFSIQQAVARPVSRVFRAVADPDELCSYFTLTADGPLEKGRTVHWSWASGGEEDVLVEDVVPDRSIVFRWRAYEVEDVTTCSLEFLPDGEEATVVKVTEYGWRPVQESLESSYEHVNGWTHMLLCLKAWLEHGLDLREPGPGTADAP